MAENEELKPCPFCGYQTIHVLQGSTFRWRYARCGGCEACAGEVRIQTSGEGTQEEWEQEARIQAIKEWNTRAEANPWRYPSRGELPDKRRRSYEVSVSFDGAANVWHSRWDGKRFDLGAVVYAWREMAEPAPPLEPEGAKE